MQLRIKELRIQQNLTQAELADKVLLTQPAIARFEAGTKEPSLSAAKRIADALGTSVDDLIAV